jgi:hypothetical protein
MAGHASFLFQENLSTSCWSGVGVSLMDLLTIYRLSPWARGTVAADTFSPTRHRAASAATRYDVNPRIGKWFGGERLCVRSVYRRGFIVHSGPRPCVGCPINTARAHRPCTWHQPPRHSHIYETSSANRASIAHRCRRGRGQANFSKCV